MSTAGSAVGRATGFELARRGQSTAANIDSALERNRAFAATGGHLGAVVFPNLRLFVITCIDPRDSPLFALAVIHHTQCGTGALADDTCRR